MVDWSDPSPGPTPEGSDRVEHRRPLIALSVIVVALVIALIITVVSLRNREAGPGAAPVSTPTAGSTPGAPVSTAVSPTPSVVLPRGSVDCSADLGPGTYCYTAPECWAGIIAVGDVPSVATPLPCGERHVYQTFAIGLLDVGICNSRSWRR